MFDNKWQKKEMPLVSLIGMGGGIASPAFLAAIILNILKPTILSPEDDTGVPDFDYTAESSAITNTSSLTTLDDFTSITSRTGQYEYIESDQNGSVFVTADVSSSNYFEISTDGGATWSNSNTVTSTPWLSLRGHCFVDSPSYKGFIFGSYGPTGSGGPVPTFKSAQGNYLSWSQAGTIPSYSSSSGRYDEIATDNDGFIVACGSHSNVAYSTNNADSWTRVSPGSGGTNTSLPHWSTCTYFAKLGKFVITTSSNSSEGNSVYLSGDTSQVQSGSWTVHDNNFPENVYINDTATNDDYLFATTSSAVWRTSDLTSWTKIADFSGTDISPYRIKVKGSIVVMSDFSTTGNTGDVIASADNGANWIYKKINSGDTFGSFDAAIDKDNNIVAVNDRKSPRVARTTLNATTTLTLTDTTVSKVLDGSLVEGESIDQVLTAGETVQADTPISSTSAASVFSTTLYNGNGQSRDLDTGIDNTDKSLIWFKNRNYDYPHILTDTVRGFSRLSSNNTQLAHSTGIDVTSFNDSGVSLTNATGWVNHPSGHEMVAWNFRAAPAFFDVVSYTGDGTGSQDISHNLGTTPGMIIVKRTDTTEDWWVYHSGLDAIGTASENDQLKLNTNNKAGVGSFRFGQIGVGFDINSSSFTVGGDDFGPLDLNQTDATYIAYVFAEDTAGLIKCGNYTGNGQGSSNTTEINCGFKPQWLMVKSTNVSTEGDNSSWCIFDNQRGYNIGGTFYSNQVLHPNSEQDESFKSGTSTGSGGGIGRGIQFTDNGFICKDNAHLFNDGAYPTDYIFVAIAENAEADITTDIYATGEVSESSGNAITLSNITGTWSTGMKVQGTDSDTKDNPDPIKVEDVSLTSSAPSAEKPVSTWGNAVWEIATDENFTQNVQTATTALSATGTQAGPSFTFEPETGYYARTKYTALGQESEWSDVTYFVTKELLVYVDEVFSTFLYDGSQPNAQTINNGLDLSGEGGLVWLKQRSSPNTSHFLFDTERGASSTLESNYNGAAYTSSRISSFNSNGFSLTNDGYSNGNGYTYVSWSFRKAPGFFDVVTYTGNGTAGRTVSHSLDSQPGMMLIKKTNGDNDWAVYHRGEGNGYVFALNDDINRTSGIQYWNYTHPTSTEFTLGDDDRVNATGDSYIAYLFAHDDQRFGTNSDESIVKCGVYSGSSSSGKFVDVGFEPQWIMIKKATDAGNDGNWLIFDAMRGIVSGGGNAGGDKGLKADSTSSEQSLDFINLNPTGFTLTTSDDNVNSQFRNYIYMAIRRPHKPATVATDVFDVGLRSGSSSDTNTNSSILTDMTFVLRRNSSSEYNGISSRLTGDHTLMLDNNTTGTTGWLDSSKSWATMNGAIINGGNGAANTGNLIDFSFKRAPGFFDVVAYAGDNSSTHEVGHNLTVIPNLIICKNLDGTSDWGVRVYAPGEGDGAGDSTGFNLNSTYQRENAGFGTFGLTTTTFRPYAVAASNGNGSGTYGSQEFNGSGSRYLALLFATLAGVSKVGAYEGTGNNINLDCGFTSGARFVLIKRVHGSPGGDWYLWNSATGIVSGNDPYMLVNSTASEVTNTDYIDPLNAGFTVTSSAPAAINASGGKYIYLAIA